MPRHKFIKGGWNPKRTHGMSESPEYAIWMGINSRCNNPNREKYKKYGARGIKVCNRWKDFSNFYEDIGPRPSKNHSIGRIDNNKNYCPQNCRWETREEQMNNRSNSVFIIYNGRKKTLAQWARQFKIPYYLLRQRIKRDKWLFEKAILTKPKSVGAL